MQHFSKITLFVALCAMAFGTMQCAKEVAPTGGPKDTIMPKVVLTKPLNQTVNFKSKRIVVTFNEFVALNNVEKNVLISPPLASRPVMKMRGKKLLIDIADTLLKPNTTYSFVFSKAIKDITENNLLDRFVYAFSTGSVIDSLRVKGKIQYAFENKPASDLYVMLYRNMHDSAPRKTLPDYLSRSTADGSFEITNIGAGNYRLFALKDTNRNYRFDQPNEMIGFSTDIITPTVTVESKTDTIHRDSIVTRKLANNKTTKDTIRRDTVITRKTNHFAPDSLRLNVFEEQSNIQYLLSSARERKEKIVFAFKLPLYNDSISVVPLDTTFSPSRLFLERNNTRDTIVCWLRDTLIRNNDTLKLIVKYLAPDTADKIIVKTDTIKPRYESKKDRFKGRLMLRTAFNVKNNASLNLGEMIQIQTSTPVMDFVADSITLEQVTDTTALQQSNGLFYKLDTAKNEIVDTLFLPNLGKAPFSDKVEPQSIASYRLGQGKFTVTFSREIEGAVKIMPSHLPTDSTWYITEIDAPTKTIVCWQKNKFAFKGETPRIDVHFLRNKKDTMVQVNLAKRQVGEKRKLGKNKTMQSKLVLSLSKTQESGLPIGQYLLLTATNPIARYDTSKIRLITLPDSARVPQREAISLIKRSTRQLAIAGRWKKSKSYALILADSACVDLWGTPNKEMQLLFKTETLHNCLIPKTVTRKVSRDSSKLTAFNLSAKWEAKKRYRLTVKRGTFLDLYVKRNDTAQVLFSIPSKETYGTLTLVLKNVEQASTVQLQGKDPLKPVKEMLVLKDTTIIWHYLAPGDYPLKAFKDKNKNKKWDAGNLKRKTQAEEIIIAPKAATVKANWESKHVWDFNDKTAPAADTTKKKLK